MVELICAYCSEKILDKKKDSRAADGNRYHIKCLRKLRKKINKLKRQGKIKQGQEAKIGIDTPC